MRKKGDSWKSGSVNGMDGKLESGHNPTRLFVMMRHGSHISAHFTRSIIEVLRGESSDKAVGKPAAGEILLGFSVTINISFLSALLF